MHAPRIAAAVSLLLFGSLLYAGRALAAEGAAADKRTPEERLRALEEEVRELKKKLAPPPPGPPADAPLAVREPPFGQFDSSWMNGTNRQPSSLLGLGPVDFSVYVDGAVFNLTLRL